MGDPERQCIGCGRRAPQSDLVRMCVEPDGDTKRVVVCEGRERTGRGAYLCRKNACLERALMRRALERAFRTSVEVDRDALHNAIQGSKNAVGSGESRRKSG